MISRAFSKSPAVSILPLCTSWLSFSNILFAKTILPVTRHLKDRTRA